MTNDERLIRRLRRRDERAFNEFVGTYQRQVFRVTLRIVGNYAEAEDVTQEVFVTVFKKVHEFREQCSLRTWVLTIAANHARNRLRYNQSRGRGQIDSWEDTDEDELRRSHGDAHGRRPDELAEAREVKDELERSWMRVDEVYRIAMTLFDIEDLSYQAISDILGVPVNTVRTRIFRGRAQWARERARGDGTDPSNTIGAAQRARASRRTKAPQEPKK